jgi:hypothetical protein
MKSRRSELQLRAADHTYWVGAENIIGATEALQLLRLFDPDVYPISARDRGERVHRYTAARDLRKRCPKVLPEERGYCASWARFVETWRLEFVLVEVPLWEPQLRVAGTLDRLAIVRRPGFPIHLAVIDGKTGVVEDWHRYQISIYELLVRHWLTLPARRWLAKLPRHLYNVYMRADGREAKVCCIPFEPVVANLIPSAQVARMVRG